MSDEQIIEALTCVKGIGRWTVEMFLMFVLNRPDVLPVDDLGLREAVREVYGLAERPTAAELTLLAEPWRPYRSVATLVSLAWARHPRTARQAQIEVAKSRKRTRHRSRQAAGYPRNRA